MSVYSAEGIPFFDIELKNRSTGVALLAADTDGIVVAFEPVAGAYETPALAVSTLDWGRNLTVGVVDANASITNVRVTVVGRDIHNRAVQETITDALTGTRTIVGHVMFASITSLTTHVDGTVTGAADTLQVGWGDEIQLPFDIALTTDITHRRMDATSGVGTLDAAKQSWILSGGNVPNAVRKYLVSGRSTVE